jgi:hypothetical protein
MSFFLFALKQNVVYSLKISVENQEDVNGSKKEGN